MITLGIIGVKGSQPKQKERIMFKPLKKDSEISVERAAGIRHLNSVIENMPESIDINAIHKSKLLEISNGYCAEDAAIVCAVFARKFPDVMYTALSNEHKNMANLLTGVDQLHLSYMEKLGKV